MSNPFFERPIVNSPYEYPRQHWELDESGQATGNLLERRRRAEFITPIPKPKKRRGSAKQEELVLDEGRGLTTKKQAYDLTSVINEVRSQVDTWRHLPASQWQVTPETARLLQHWRHHEFGGVRPFFCQIEAVETAIWFTEVASHLASGKRLIENLKTVNAEANPHIERLALKLATGAGKTTVMAMLIAWQTLNAVRRPGSKHCTRGFLIVAPGLTIRDRLHVLQPNDPDNYYGTRELVPHDLLEDMKKARIVITNYHAFKRRDRMELSAGGRTLRQGATGPELQTLETEGQMLQRVMPELMGMKQILALNDEAHHCYRERPPDPDDEALKGDERKEAEKNNEAARFMGVGPRSSQSHARTPACRRSLGDAVLSAWLRLRRRHALPLDDERLFANGCHRMRHRQAAARACRRKHSRRRDAGLPQPLGAHPQGYAQEGTRRRR